MNDRPFQKLPGSRRALFEASERAALRPLPETRYELADWRRAKVNIDYHVSVERHLDWTPSRLIAWGAHIGRSTEQVVTQILERYPHPEQGYRACLGLFSLARRYTPVRLESAAQRALATAR